MATREITLPGRLVIKAAQNLPQTATANLYVGSGGSLLVTGLLGLVTTATGATVTNLSVGTTASSAAIMTATSIATKAAGTWILPTSATGVGGAPVFVLGAAFPTVTGDRLLQPFLLAAGQSITWTTSAGDTGQIAWYCWYIPIDADSGLS